MHKKVLINIGLTFEPKNSIDQPLTQVIRYNFEVPKVVKGSGTKKPRGGSFTSKLAKPLD